MPEKSENLKGIINYYLTAESQYFNWGRDEKRNGIYALHCGFSKEGQTLTHYEEIKQLTSELIRFAEIPPNAMVLDAGCGSGAVSFELSYLYPDARIIGINIAGNQLSSANLFKKVSEANKVNFSRQDYHNLAFLNNVSDVVIFCESYTHSWDKDRLLQETARVLKPAGKLVISDVFIKRKPTDKKEQEILNDLMTGWYMPNIQEIKEFEDITRPLGLCNLVIEEHTTDVINSSRRMREHTELKLLKDPSASVNSDVLNQSRKAVIACNEAFERGIIGYYFVQGSKSEEI